MLERRYCALRTVFMTAAALAISASPLPAADAGANSAAAERERPLIALLQSQAPPQDKAIACKRLAVCGSPLAVPALAALLADKELSSWARIALEAIPHPAADAALRTAAGKLQGRLLVGVINSLGVRRDAQAVAVLVPKLNDADAAVATAAAVALGHIGDAPAQKALEQALAAIAAAVRPAVAEGCLLCAERRLAEGSAAPAVALYDKVRGADVPQQQVLEATRGAILARAADGATLLAEQLRSADKARFALGLTVARELPGRAVSELLVAELAKTTPQRQGPLILALADRGDAAPLPALLEAAKQGPDNVRIVALRAIQRQGNVSCVPLLLETAMGSDADLATAAAAALAGLPGSAVDADLAARLPKAEGKLRLLLVELAGQRRIAAAAPALLQAADDPDPSLRCAALTALGATIASGELPHLIDRAVKPRDPQEAKVAEAALYTACVRMPDREACADKLVVAMTAAPVPTKCAMLKVLGAMGGSKALAAVAAAARDASPELQDTGSRLLGEWMSMDAAPELLALAKTAHSDKFQVRALRGYIRLARQLNPPPPQRLAMCREALAAAQRNEERQLVLQVLGRVATPASLALVAPYLGQPRLQEAASLAAVKIAEKMVPSNPAAVTAAMRQVVKTTQDKQVAQRAKTLLTAVAKP